MEHLAGLIGCTVDDVPELLERFPAREPRDARRLRALRLVLFDGFSYQQLGDLFGFTREWGRCMIRTAIDQLIEVHRGRAELPARLRNGISNSLGLTSWTVEEVAPKLECSTLLRTKNIGRTSVRQLHALLRSRRLMMKCGCPSLPCAVAVDRLAARVVVSSC